MSMAFYRMALALYVRARVFCARRIGPRRGQSLVEYLIMLTMIVAICIIVFVKAEKTILGAFFTLVGMILPKSS